jgi:hypothetical protein
MLVPYLLDQNEQICQDDQNDQNDQNELEKIKMSLKKSK